MIGSQLISDAVRALRVLEVTTPDANLWPRVRELLGQLAAAAASGDEDGFAAVLRELERLGVSRNTGRRQHEIGGVLGNKLNPVAWTGQIRSTLEAVKRADRPDAVEPTSDALRRTPHMDLSEPVPLTPGMEFHVDVYLDRKPPREGEHVEDFVVDAPVDEDELVIDVWLRGSSHFVIEGDAVRPLRLRPAEEVSSKATFNVRVRDDLVDVEEPRLAASFAYNVRASGLVERVVPIELPGQVTAPPAGPTRAGGARIDPVAAKPDLMIEVFRRDGRSDEYDVKLTTPLLGGVVRDEVWHLDAGAPQLVAQTMERFLADDQSPNARRASLLGAGTSFFKVAPRAFQELYWEIVDAGQRLSTVYLVSEDRAIPWELMIPTDPSRRRPEQPPLGVTCAFGRWHRDTHMSPTQTIPLEDSLIVAPLYTGRSKLKKAEEEVAFVLDHFPGQRGPGRFDDLDAWFRERSASLLHFVCHGVADRGGVQAIKLEGKEVLDAQQIGHTGLAVSCRRSQPLVFLNACEVGRPAPGLTPVEGFAPSFIEQDAAGILAALWSVDDEAAHRYTVEFYTQVLAEPTTPFAEIVRRLRSRAYADDPVDTYAAYCFYGDPRAAVAPAV